MVKSGKISGQTIAILNSDRGREKADLAVLFTLKEPTKGMLKEAKAASKYKHRLLSRREEDIIKIVTIKDILENDARLDLPSLIGVLKKGEAVDVSQQDTFF